jgi:signal peptidase I
MQQKIKTIWFEWRGFLLFIAVMLMFRSAIADWNQVPTGSMIPSILAGDRIVVDKAAYDLRVPFTLIRITRWADPQRSDVITFESPKDGRLLVKRVIGIPGDLVELRGNTLYINGEIARYETVARENVAPDVRAVFPHFNVIKETILGESRLVMTDRRAYHRSQGNFGPIVVPEESYLVLGDNRDNSQDFRFIGFIERDLILGRADSVAFSLNYDNYYVPRADRFFRDLE